MKKLICASALLVTTVSFNAMSFGLPKAEVPSVSSDAQNMITALQVIQDGGIKCSKITDFKVSNSVKGYQVECDSKKKYTLLDTTDGLVLKTK